MTSALTIQQLASDVRKQFVRKTRDNGESFWIRESNEEDWIYRLCMDAHGEMLPDDWRYAFIIEALDTLSENEDEDDARDSIEADIYTSELTRWLGSRADRYGYVDEAMEAYTEVQPILTMIQLGQLAEKTEVFESVLQSLQTRMEEMEGEEG